LCECASQRSEIGGSGGGRVGIGDGEDGVDYVEDATGEVEVLGCVLVSEESEWVIDDWQGSGKMRDVDGTYSSDDCALCQQTTEDIYTRAVESCLDSLTSSHIGVSCVRQQSGQELRRVRESRCWIRTIQDVVGQERSDEARVGGCRLACRRVEERCQSLIVGREDGDVACAAES
jgi:hypothetical protein